MNNSAITRRISKIALEYNGNDKGTACTTAINNLLGTSAEEQIKEMKMVVRRNKNVKQWALTGYISPEKEIGDQLSDEELTEICLEALKDIGLTQSNQYRLDVHHSTRQKHIHFVVNRVDTFGRCTIKSANIGKLFGEATRRAFKRRNYKTDIEIGKEKRAEMLENLLESIKSSDSFETLEEEMKGKGYQLIISKNEKVGISGMRIVRVKDINHQTEKQYPLGYKLSEVSSKLKIQEIKQIFEVKKLLLGMDNSLFYSDFQKILVRNGFSLKMQKDKDGITRYYLKNNEESYKNGFFTNAKNGVNLDEIGFSQLKLGNWLIEKENIVLNTFQIKR